MRFMAAIGLAAALAGPAMAQGTTAKSAGPTVGFMHAIHATDRLEATLAFYRDVFGLDAPVFRLATAMRLHGRRTTSASAITNSGRLTRRSSFTNEQSI